MQNPELKYYQYFEQLVEHDYFEFLLVDCDRFNIKIPLIQFSR